MQKIELLGRTVVKMFNNLISLLGCSRSTAAGMLLSKINSLAHLRSGPGAELHAAKLPAGEAPRGGARRCGVGLGLGKR